MSAAAADRLLARHPPAPVVLPKVGTRKQSYHLRILGGGQKKRESMNILIPVKPGAAEKLLHIRILTVRN